MQPSWWKKYIELQLYRKIKQKLSNFTVSWRSKTKDFRFMTDKNGKLRTVVAPPDGKNWKRIFCRKQREGILRELKLSVKNLGSSVVKDYIEKRRSGEHEASTINDRRAF